MRPESAALVWDARTAAVHARTFVSGFDEAAYRRDEVRKSAVERQMEILGEALNNLRKVDPETAARIPDVRRIIGLRNVLAHGYAVVDDSVVWDAASRRVASLIDVLDQLLAELA